MNIRTSHAVPEARKQRLQREALGNAGGLMPSAEGVGKVFVAIGLAFTALAISSGRPVRSERVVTLSAYANVASTGQSLPVVQPGDEDGPAAPEGNVQDLTY